MGRSITRHHCHITQRIILRNEHDGASRPCISIAWSSLKQRSSCTWKQRKMLVWSCIIFNSPLNHVIMIEQPDFRSYLFCKIDCAKKAAINITMVIKRNIRLWLHRTSIYATVNDDTLNGSKWLMWRGSYKDEKIEQINQITNSNHTAHRAGVTISTTLRCQNEVNDAYTHTPGEVMHITQPATSRRSRFPCRRPQWRRGSFPPRPARWLPCLKEQPSMTNQWWLRQNRRRWIGLQQHSVSPHQYESIVAVMTTKRFIQSGAPQRERGWVNMHAVIRDVWQTTMN